MLLKKDNSVDELLEVDEHKIKMEKLYADAEEFLNEEYGKPLEDEEIALLHELFERAKRDDRFKDGLKDIKLSDIYYDAMFIKLKVFDDKRGDVDEGN